jgi:hypothetical protein
METTTIIESKVIESSQQMENPTFLSVIEKIITEFDIKYTSIESLQQIVLDLDSLQPGVHMNEIIVLKRTIREFGKANGRLTDRQSKKLLNLLIGYKTPIKPKKETPIYDTSYYNEKEPKYEEPIVIFDDRAISKVIFTFLTSLNYASLSSSLNIVVSEYFLEIECVLEGAPQRYYELTKIIKGILEDHGWKMGSGFQREPNQMSLVFHLDIVIKKYFF